MELKSFDFAKDEDNIIAKIEKDHSEIIKGVYGGSVKDAITVKDDHEIIDHHGVLDRVLLTSEKKEIKYRYALAANILFELSREGNPFLKESFEAYKLYVNLLNPKTKNKLSLYRKLNNILDNNKYTFNEKLLKDKVLLTTRKGSRGNVSNTSVNNNFIAHINELNKTLKKTLKDTDAKNKIKKPLLEKLKKKDEIIEKKDEIISDLTENTSLDSFGDKEKLELEEKLENEKEKISVMEADIIDTATDNLELGQQLTLVEEIVQEEKKKVVEQESEISELVKVTDNQRETISKLSETLKQKEEELSGKLGEVSRLYKIMDDTGVKILQDNAEDFAKAMDNMSTKLKLQLKEALDRVGNEEKITKISEAIKEANYISARVRKGNVDIELFKRISKLFETTSNIFKNLTKLEQIYTVIAFISTVGVTSFVAIASAVTGVGTVGVALNKVISLLTTKAKNNIQTLKKLDEDIKSI